MIKNHVRLAVYLILFLLSAITVYADVAYPMYIKPGFSMRHIRTLASERGFPPAYYPLPKPEGADEVIPLCVISEYTPKGHPNLSWSCGFEDIGDSVRFALSAYYEHEGWVEATAIVLDSAYFELVPIGQVQGDDTRQAVIEFHLGSDESQTILLDSAYNDQIIPLVAMTVYETGEDGDFQFHISDSSVLSRPSPSNETLSFTIETENGNEDSYLEGAIYFIRPKFQEKTWLNDLVRATNGQEFDHPDSGAVEAKTGYNTLIIPSLIAYVADNDEDFAVKNFPNLSDNQAWFQMSALNGNDGSWAEWQNIIIHVPEDKNALSDEPFDLPPPATATIQPTEEPTTTPEEPTTAPEEPTTTLEEPTTAPEEPTTAPPIEKSEAFNPLPYLLFFGALVIIGIILFVFWRRQQEKK
jgi:hypothetical protein